MCGWEISPTFFFYAAVSKLISIKDGETKWLDKDFIGKGLRIQETNLSSEFEYHDK